MDYETNKKLKGKQGEEIVLHELKRVFGENALFFQNIFVPAKNGNKPFECDIICVSKKGLFVFEVKNWEGHIEGDMLSQKWGFKGKGKSEYIQLDNPVIQNNIHRKVLSDLLGEQVTSIVVLNNVDNYFTINKYSEDQVKVPVLLTTELQSYFWNNHFSDVLTEQKFYSLFSKLKDMEIQSNQYKKENLASDSDNNTSVQENSFIDKTNNDQSYKSNCETGNKQGTDNKSHKKKLTSTEKVLLILGVLFALMLVSFFASGIEEFTKRQRYRSSESSQASVVPTSVQNRHKYSIDELSRLPIVTAPQYQEGEIHLGQSILHRTYSQSYVENHETKYNTADLYITPVEYLVGNDAQDYYNYLSSRYKFSRPLRQADNEEYAVVRLYAWFVSDKINNIAYTKEVYAESLGKMNGMIRFYIGENTNYYLSNETGQMVYLTGYYFEDIDNMAISSNNTITSGSPVEIIYLIPLSSDFEYKAQINPDYFAHNSDRARLILN